MSTSSSSVTSGFVDLATYDELEKYMYGGPDATAYFVREHRKATWFTQVPVTLTRSAGNPAFNTEWEVAISRAGDYLLNSWLRLTIPTITRVATDNTTLIRWTRNFMHNIIREAAISFNDLVSMRFDNYFLDFFAAFTVPAGKRTGYNNMIGNFAALTSSSVGPLPAATLNLPLPFWFNRDSGVALPTAALPYNEMRMRFSFRDWTDLLIVDDISGGTSPATNYHRAALAADITTTPALTNVQVWANYAIVSNDERKRMACAPRDILIEQVQTAPRQTFNPSTDATPRYDVRFSHAVKVIFFGCRNTTTTSEWSNYTAGCPTAALGSTRFDAPSMVDPILQTSLVYESTTRLAQMGSDYFSLVSPWFHAPVIPLETGYHMYSYSLDFVNIDPLGSTNYGKLTHIGIQPEASTPAVNASTGAGLLGATFANTWDFIAMCINNNVVRIAGGALGFPVL